MHIVHVFHHYYPFIGGMEKVIQGLAEAQALLGHDVEVITSKYGSENRPDSERYNNVEIHRADSWRFRFPDLTYPVKVQSSMFDKADVVHVHGHNSLFSKRFLLAASKLKIKTACYFMAVNAFKDHPNIFIRTFGDLYGKKNTRDALSSTKLALVKNSRDLEILEKYYGVKAKILPDAVKESVLKSEKNAFDFRECLHISQPSFFLFIGRMHKLKGPHVLVNALKYTPDNIAAVFIGPDGGYLKETLNLAERLGVRDRIYALGFVDEAVKIAAIDSSVALVLPSVADYVEVYPGVISEAWAREKPVIASNVGGIPYRVRDHANGLLVDPSNPKMLANSMLELLNNDLLAKVLGRAGKSDVFSWDVIAQKSIELYRGLLSE